MLDLVKAETERIDARFLESACGSGNFLVQVLQRKLAAVELKFGKSEFEKRNYALFGLMCTYGVELLPDNIAECRDNMLEILSGYLNLNDSDDLYRAAIYVLSQNLVHGDALTMLTSDGQPIMFAEWGYLGKGKFQRRDFRLDALIKARIAELFGDDMQFDVIIGNPPYQLNDGGYGTSATPIYNKFVDQAKKLDPRLLTMIIPSRWFAGGKGLDEFRQSMLTDDRLRSIDDYLSASDVFPDGAGKGGVCYFLWDRDNPGRCRVSTHFKDEVPSTTTRQLLEEGVDVFIRFNEGLSILKKVVAVETGQTRSLSLPETKRFDRLVSSRKPFGLDTTFKGKVSEGAGDLLVYQNGGTGYVARSAISTGTHLIDKWKIFHGYAAPGTGNRDTYPHRIISTPFLGEPGSICSETYLCIGPFDSKSQAESALSYLSCRMTRLLILLHKPSQHTTRKVYSFVPTQEWTKWWTDEVLYAKYSLSISEIAFIEKMVRPMEFAGLAEVAGLARVSRSRAGQLAAHPDFPEPVQRLHQNRHEHECYE